MRILIILGDKADSALGKRGCGKVDFKVLLNVL